ncbi:hypothetical protein PsorP6_003243 [Peronosclerospora sorghi]|uniref:Uncharacterized protein n=1 Tax=Peronosclerospora sorghi TaxID=230839 RepID=A0ACC0VQA3_9STRA|nr:hypothetical protein PsorP6_003243 [Peronosclerospora sorghi]
MEQSMGLTYLDNKALTFAPSNFDANMYTSNIDCSKNMTPHFFAPSETLVALASSHQEEKFPSDHDKDFQTVVENSRHCYELSRSKRRCDFRVTGNSTRTKNRTSDPLPISYIPHDKDNVLDST